MKIDIYNDSISYVTNEVSTVPVDESNLNEENRMKFVTDLAAVSRGKHESKNPAVRYKALLKEAALGTPSRPVEFCGVVMTIIYDMTNRKRDILLCDTDPVARNEVAGFSYADFFNKIAKYSYVVDNKVYTNLRACINAGIPYDKIPYNTKEELSGFRALKASVPMFVWAQVPNTHTAISKEAQSDRVAVNNGYWLPKDFIQKCIDYKTAFNIRDTEKENIANLKYLTVTLRCLAIGGIAGVKKYLLGEANLSQNDMFTFFKKLGYKREVYSRAMYYFKYKEVVMTGWMHDPKVWKHLFVERNAEPELWKNWTQSETEMFVKTIKEIIEGV